MEAQAKSKIHPLVAVASIAVIIFSAVGVAALTGHLPGTSAQKSPEQIISPSAPAASAPVAALSPQAPAVAPAPAPAAATPPGAPPRQAKPVQKPVQRAESPTQVAAATQSPRPVPVAQAPRVCADCGSVIDVREVEVKGEGSGVGAVAGGVAGAIIGNQFGHGGGKTVARVAGAAGGAYAGHQIEKKVRSHKRYDVVVRMEAGGERTVSYESPPTWRSGDRVRIVDGKLEPDR